MARPLIVGNWKAYVTTLKDARTLLKRVEKSLPRGLAADIVVAPTAPLVGVLTLGYKGRRIAFAAQDVFYEEGAHTGAIPAAAYVSVGVRYAIVGHAEERARGDTDEIVAKKAAAAIAAGMTAVVCVGEHERDQDGHYLATLEKSLLASLARIEAGDLKRVVIAYEPVWAIGATTPMRGRDIRETIIFIRKVLSARFERERALKVGVLYGGAVDPDHVAELVAESGASGFLVGRASVNAEEFAAIIRAFH